jgi:hypothetical protein
MLNWKATGPVLLSVAVAVNAMLSPMGCGEACDGSRDTIETVAKAGTDKTISTPATNRLMHEVV